MDATVKKYSIGLICSDESGGLTANTRKQLLQELSPNFPELNQNELAQLSRLLESSSGSQIKRELLKFLVEKDAASKSPDVIKAIKEFLVNPEAQSQVISMLGSKNLRSVTDNLFLQLAKNPSLIPIEIKRGAIIAEHQKNLQIRLQRLPLLREAIHAVIRCTESGNQYRAILERRKLFSKTASGDLKSIEPGYDAVQKVRPLFAALASSTQGRELLSVVVDEYNTKFAKSVWKQLNEQRNPYVPEIIVGSGPSAVNYRSTVMALRPTRQPLIVDAAPYVGGQFASFSDPMWYLNSRARPLSDITRENLPGTESPLNTLGPYCPIQESDLTNSVYGDQSNLALSIQLNHLLAGGVLTSTRVVGWNFNQSDSQGAKYIVKLERDSKELLVFTDRIIFARGIGKASFAFSNQQVATNSATANIIAEENAIFQSGNRPTYMTFPQFFDHLANRANPTPLKDIKKVAVIGNGDGGKVVVEALLGYGPKIGITPQEVDHVESIIWVGQNIKTKEEFQACERARYSQIALDFPRKKNGAAYYRITPEPGRATALSKAKTGKLNLVTDTKEYKDFDMIVDASGYTNYRLEGLYDPKITSDLTTEQSVPPTQTTGTSLQDAEDIEQDTKVNLTDLGDKNLNVLLGSSEKWIATSQIVFSESSLEENKLDDNRLRNFAALSKLQESWKYFRAKEDQILLGFEADGKTIKSALVFTKKQLYVVRVSDLGRLYASSTSWDVSRSRSTLYSNYDQSDKTTLESTKMWREVIMRDSIANTHIAPAPISEPKQEKLVTKTILGKINGQDLPLARIIAGQEIYAIGPESQLELSSDEKTRLNINFIKENTAAVFLYSGRVTTLAERIAEQDRDLPIVQPIIEESSQYDSAILTISAETSSDLSNFLNRERIIGFKSNLPNIISIFVDNAYRGIRFPELEATELEASELSVTINRKINSNNQDITFSVSSNTKGRLTDLIESVNFQKAVYRLLSQPPYGSRYLKTSSVVYTAPIKDGRLCWEFGSIKPVEKR